MVTVAVQSEEKVPFASVVATLLPPIEIVAPDNGCWLEASITLPVICCALAVTATTANAANNKIRFIVFNLNRH